MHTVSIIIPVYNESTCIEGLVGNLKQLQGTFEVIFVDGGSTDGTLDMIAKDFLVVKSPEKGRSCQMNYGATLAKGDVLFFLHADSILPEDALMQIERVMLQYQVGCFPIQFASKSPLMAICAWMSNLRVKLRNIAFGDQGIFIKKAYFMEIGMFAAIPLMEDYQLSLTIKDNRQRFGLAASKIITSERRFLKHGRLKTMIRMQMLQHMYRRGEDIELIAKMYRGD